MSDKEHDELIELRDRLAFMEWQAQALSNFAKMLDRAPLVMFAVDAQGTTTMSHGKGLALLGVAQGEHVGRDELAATRGTPAHDALLRALGGDEVRELVEPVPGRFFDTLYVPLRNENNEADGVLGLAIDATERVRSERQLSQKARVVEEQSRTIRALSAPVIKIWHEVLCMPIVGGVDAERATQMMEKLLEAIVREQARWAILDLTGVEAMDTSTVQHVVRILASARALGVQGLLSGVQPAVAQAMVVLGADVGELRMTRTLHDALAQCMQAPAPRKADPARSGGERSPQSAPSRSSK